jgi:hypothetical protein
MAFVNHPLKQLEKPLRDYVSPRFKDIMVQETDSKLEATNYEIKARIIEMVATNTFRGMEMDNPTQYGMMKDRLGDQRGGSEWEPIKFFSKEIETPTR